MAHLRRIGIASAVSCCLVAAVSGLVFGGRAWAQPSGGGSGSDTQGGAPVDSTSGGGNAPPGNNGHIQVDEWTMDAGNDNDPHLSCGFSVSFFGYDGGTQHATITVTPWAPTGGGHPATFGPVTWDVGTRTSGNQLDANYPVSWPQLAPVLVGVTPTAQGYHVRIEVEVTGSRGADDKFKMFWLEPCSSSPPSSGGSGGTTTTTTVPATTTSTTTTTTTAPPTRVAGGGGTGNDTGAFALDSTTLPLLNATPALATAVSRGATPSRGLLAGALAFTGANVVPLAVCGLALCGAGGVLALIARRRRLRA